MLTRLGAEAHLWLAETADPAVRRRFPLYRELLSDSERLRLERIRVERARDEYLLGRALARTTLSRYAPVAPGAWELTPDDLGRPHITGPDRAPALGFNLAHSHGLVACLVAREAQAGVDVEHLDRGVDTRLLAQRYFSRREQREVFERAGEAGRDAFFRYWTLKEAYLKARGVGISVPLRNLSFAIAADGRIDVRFHGTLDDRPADWEFQLFRAPSAHLVAVALRRREPTARRVMVHRVVPLERSSEVELDRIAGGP